MSKPVLELKNVSVHFHNGPAGVLRALHEVSLTLERGEILAIVGESGSGKSTLAKVLARLLVPQAGEMFLDGARVESARSASKAYRKRVQMVFQDPFASLNPAHTVLHHIARPLLLHGQCGPQEVRKAAAGLLDACGLGPGEAWLDAYPHRLSGGQRQRVAIARALAPRPDLLIADEPTSMLDVSIRTDVLRLLRGLRDSHGLSQILITHDLGAARFMADRIIVLYGGEVMEGGPAESLMRAPVHPYSRLLLAAAPREGGSLFSELPVRPGELVRRIDGCPFAERCPAVVDRCTSENPAPRVLGGHLVRCHTAQPNPGPGTAD